MLSNNSGPFVGPRPFDTADRLLFFGRDQEADKLVSLVTAHPVTLLYAPSGAGKTSLLNARLIPLLRAEGFDVLPPARVQGQTQITIPPEDIANIFIFNSILDWPEAGGDQRRLARKTLREFLAERDREARAREGAPAEAAPRVIIFDQMEEVFTLYPERWSERQGFFEQVRDALNPGRGARAARPGDEVEEHAPPLRVLILMREDYIAGLDSYAHLLPEKLRTRFRLEHLRQEAALEAVVKPLEGTGRRFGDGVAESLVDNLMKIPSPNPGGEWEAGQYVEPVQLQVVCQSLWLALKENQTVITHKHLEKYGDVNEALRGFYERSVAEVAGAAGVSEAFLRAWFGHKLIRSEGVRGIVYRGPAHTAKLPNEAVDRLERLHLIKGELRGNSRWYELSHERLIRPIRESNEQWVSGLKAVGDILRHMEKRAGEWERAGRDKNLLLNDGELHQAERLLNVAERGALSPSDELLDLIEASRTAQASRQSRVLKRGLAAAVAMFLLMGLLAVRAYRAENRAERNLQDFLTAQRKELDAQKKEREARMRAEEARMRAEEALADAVEARKEATNALGEARAKEKESLAQKERAEAERRHAVVARAAADKARRELEEQSVRLVDALARAEAQRRAADQQRVMATARELAAYAREVKAEDPELAIILSERSLNKARTTEGERALRDSLAQLASVSNVLRGLARGQDHATAIAPENVAASPDGRLIAAVVNDSTSNVGVWDVAAGGRPVRELVGHMAEVHAVAFSPDGKYIATEAGDRTGKLWSVDGKELFTMQGLTGPIAALAFSPDGTKLVAESGTSTAKVWEIPSGKELYTLKNHPAPVSTVAFSPDSQLVATATTAGSVHVWNAAAGTPVARGTASPSHRGRVLTVGFSPNSQHLVTAGVDGTARVWDAQTGAQTVLDGHTGRVNSAVFDASGGFVLTAGADKTAQIYSISGQRVVMLSGHTNRVNSAVFSDDGKYILTASEDKSARVWSRATGEVVKKLPHGGNVYRAFYSPAAAGGGGQNIVGVSDDGTAWVWDIESRHDVTALLGHRGGVTSASFSPDGKSIVTTGDDNTVRLWDAASRRQTGRLNTNDGSSFGITIYNASFSHGGKHVVTASDDGRARVWDVQAQQVVAQVDVEDFATERKDTFVGSEVLDAAFSSDDRYVVLATSTAQGRAYLWEWQRWKTDGGDQRARAAAKRAAPLVLGDADINIGKVAFSLDPESRYIAAGSAGGAVYVWERTAGGDLGQPVKVAEGGVEVAQVAFSPDATYLAAAYDDSTIRLWAWKTPEGRQRPSTLFGHSDRVNSVRFSPDGELLVSASRDRTVRVWNWRTWVSAGPPAAPIVLSGHEAEVYAAAFSPDSRSIITASADGRALIFPKNQFAPLEELKRVIPKLRDLTTDEQKLYLRDGDEATQAAFNLPPGNFDWLKRWLCEPLSP